MSPIPAAAPARSNPRIPYEMSSARAKLRPPGGKPLIVHVVVNIEECRRLGTA